jgi:hypothetical protein
MATRNECSLQILTLYALDALASFHMARLEASEKARFRMWMILEFRRFIMTVVVVCLLLLPHPCCAVEEHSLDRDRLAPFDTDIREDCPSLQSYCQSEIFAHIFLQCPASCAAMLEQPGMKGTADDNPDALWDDEVVPTLRTYKGKIVGTERFEGTVTVVCILPLLPGMAVYYYEMLEHLHGVFAPKVEFVILPIDHQEGIHIQIRKNPKVLVMEEESSIWTHPWVKHLTSIKPRSGAAEKNHRDEIVQVELNTDRVTFYIVSADGYYIERLVSPTMANLKERVMIYLKTIDYEL